MRPDGQTAAEFLPYRRATRALFLRFYRAVSLAFGLRKLCNLMHARTVDMDATNSEGILFQTRLYFSYDSLVQSSNSTEIQLFAKQRSTVHTEPYEYRTRQNRSMTLPYYALSISCPVARHCRACNTSIEHFVQYGY
eukprot:scaffold61783_cov17-Prasinocladus_malaysianus.AAC.1